LAGKVAASVFHWLRGFLSLQMMSGRRMRPDLTNHNTVLANAGAAGAWTMALVVKERINHLRLGPDVITYNGSISACHKAPLGGNPGGFFFEVKREFGKAPNSKNQFFAPKKCSKFSTFLLSRDLFATHKLVGAISREWPGFYVRM